MKPGERRPRTAGRLYGGKWQRESAEFLRLHPTCEMERPGPDNESVLCGRRSSIVHHTKPHGGDWQVFWDRKLWKAACKDCHDGPVQSEERAGRPRGCRSDGTPLDPNHRWNRARAIR